MKKIDVRNSLIFGSEVEDVKNSLEYLDQLGYFSNSEDFSEYTENSLDVVEVADFVVSPYGYVYDGDRHVFEYFIPKSEVVFIEEEPKKKELRAFKSLEEFFIVTGFKVGDIVQIKNCTGYAYEETTLITSFRYYTDNEIHRTYVVVGVVARSLDELFKNYKYFKNGEWLHFGVEE